MEPMDLTGDAFVQALQSENIHLVIGKDDEQIIISKTLLCQKSAFIDKVITEKKADTIDMQAESTTAVKMFVRWCYQDYIQPLPASATFQEKQKSKIAFIDLWIFAAHYKVSKLQNQVMAALIALFNTTALLTLKDVQYVWNKTSGIPSPVQLRNLAVMNLVAQIEDESGENQRPVADLEKLKLESFISRIYKTHKAWLEFSEPKMAKKNRPTKWELFTKDKYVRATLMVGESAHDFKYTSPSVKKEVRCDGNIPARKRKAAEIIDLTEDD